MRKYGKVAVWTAAVMILVCCASHAVESETSFVKPVPAPAAAVAQGPADALQLGDEIEYRVKDKFTNVVQAAIFRVDSVEADRLRFNQGGRIEGLNGELIKTSANIAGDLDALEPPGGWGKAGLTPGTSWSVKYNGNGAASVMNYSLKAVVGEATRLQTPLGELEVTPVTYSGWGNHNVYRFRAASRVSVRLWYAPQIKRVVRFESDVRSPSSGGPILPYSVSRELAELVAIRRRPVVTKAPMPLASAPAPAAAVAKGPADPLQLGDEIEYRVKDKFTNVVKAAIFRVDRVEADRLRFNQGERIESLNGGLIKIGANIAGDLDALEPPGGWVKEDLAPGASWSVKYTGNGGASIMSYSLKAVVGEKTSSQTPLGVLEVTPVTYSGWGSYNVSRFRAASRVSVRLWYAPQLKRVVRFESDVRSPSTGGVNLPYSVSRELAELVAIRRR